MSCIILIGKMTGGMWVNLGEYPDYNTQGETLEEFEDMLRSLYDDIKTYDFSLV